VLYTKTDQLCSGPGAEGETASALSAFFEQSQLAGSVETLLPQPCCWELYLTFRRYTMKKQISQFLMGIAVFSLVFAMLFAVAPVQGALANGAAYSQGLALQEEPPVDPPVVEPTIVIVPDTGGNQTNIFIDNWIIWVILGAVIIALLAALVARGGSTTHYHD
jgi:hypothetical protein